ncbi:MAG: transposase [Gammaproteobacteria bacterium]
MSLGLASSALLSDRSRRFFHNLSGRPAVDPARTSVVRRKESRRFVLLPRRSVVERTFSWLNHCRRLSKDYERLMPTRETWIYLAMIKLMANRLA